MGADVGPPGSGLLVRRNAPPASDLRDVVVHDGVRSSAIERVEERWRCDVHAGEVAVQRSAAHRPRNHVRSTAARPVPAESIVIEHEITFLQRRQHGERRECVVLDVAVVERRQVDIREYIAVVQEERRITPEQVGGVLQPTARIEGCAGLVRQMDFHAEAVGRPDQLLDGLGEVVRIDDDSIGAGLYEAARDVLDDGSARHIDEGFGPVVRQGPESGAESGREDHGIHPGQGSGGPVVGKPPPVTGAPRYGVPLTWALRFGMPLTWAPRSGTI
jgi:hypothetical protein